MKISLHRASSLENQIVTAIDDIRIVTTIKLTEFHNCESELNRANVTLFTRDARRQRLLLSLHTVRGLTAAARSASGIDINLAKTSFIEDRLRQLKEIIDLDPAHDINVIKSQLEKISQSTIDRTNNTVSTTVVSQDQLNQTHQEILNLRRQYQQLMDDIFDLYIKTQIPLNDDIVKTLSDEGIIDVLSSG
jgi:hypothetical protein